MARSNVFPIGATRLAEVIRTTAPQLPEQLVAQLTADISRVAESSGGDQFTVDEVLGAAHELRASLTLLNETLDVVSDGIHTRLLLQLAGQCAAILELRLNGSGIPGEDYFGAATPPGTTDLKARLHQVSAMVRLVAVREWRSHVVGDVNQLGWVVFAARDLLNGVLEALKPNPVQGVAA